METKPSFAVFENTGVCPYSLDCSQKLTFARGKVITLPPGIGLISKGNVKVTANESGVLLNTIPAGGMFGASTLFAGRDLAGTTLTASGGETQIIFIPEEDFASLLQKNEKLLRSYLGFVSKRICFLGGKVGTLSSQSAEDKLLRHILQNGGSINVKSMTELAKMLSMGRASLYRAADALEKGGRIKRDGKKLRLI